MVERTHVKSVIRTSSGQCRLNLFRASRDFDVIHAASRDLVVPSKHGCPGFIVPVLSDDAMEDISMSLFHF